MSTPLSGRNFLGAGASAAALGFAFAGAGNALGYGTLVSDPNRTSPPTPSQPVATSSNAHRNDLFEPYVHDQPKRVRRLRIAELA